MRRTFPPQIDNKSGVTSVTPLSTLFCKNRIPASVTNALIVPVRCPVRCLVLHTTLLHNISRMWIARIVISVYAPHTDLMKQIINHCCQRF